jgi:hypothetical protein
VWSGSICCASFSAVVIASHNLAVAYPLPIVACPNIELHQADIVQ